MTTLAIILIALLLVALIAREPELRRRFVAIFRRREGRVRAAVGLSQPRDLQRQAIALIKEQSLVSIDSVHLPSDVTVLLHPEDFKVLEGLETEIRRQMVDEIKALDGVMAGQDARFSLSATPNVSFERDLSVRRGEADVRLLFLEGTVAITILQTPAGEDDTGPAGVDHPIRLLVEIHDLEPFATTLHGTGLVGRGPGCNLRIDHDSVSREHARLAPSGDGTMTVVDVRSRNGVRIGDDPDPIAPNVARAVALGDRLRLSRYVSMTLIDETTRLAPS